MAKIYETQKDVQRDRLNREAEREANHATSLSTLGALGVGASLVALSLKNSKEAISKTLIWLPAATGLLASVAAWFSVSKSRKARNQLEQLGPEEIIMPKAPESSKRVYGMEDVKITPDPNDPKKATVEMNLDPSDFKDLEDKLSADNSVNWQKKVEGENKSISLVAQKQ